MRSSDFFADEDGALLMEQHGGQLGPSGKRVAAG
jgi:hypothetical protein